MWNKEDKKMLFQALATMTETANDYGKEFDIKARLKHWKFILEEKYTAKEVIAGLKIFMSRNTTIPYAADINNALDPLITNAQYVTAQKRQEKNGYPMFSEEKMIINKFEKQRNEGKQVLNQFLQLENKTKSIEVKK